MNRLVTLITLIGRATPVLCSAALSCGTAVYIVHQFELERCPDETFSLPAAAERGPYRLESKSTVETELTFQGFTGYVLFDNRRVSQEAEVRLNRGTSCTIDVAYGYVRAIGARKPRTDIEQQATPLIEIIAQLVLDGSTTTARVPAATVERLSSRALKRQHAQSADTAGQ